MGWAARRGDRFEQSVFFTQRPTVAGRTLTGGDQRVTVSERAGVVLQRGYSSGADPKLFRARIRFRASRGRGLSVTVCAK